MITQELLLRVSPEKLREAANSVTGYRDTLALAAKAEWTRRRRRGHDKLWNIHLFRAQREYAPVVEACSPEDLRCLIHKEAEMMALVRKALKRPAKPSKARNGPPPVSSPPVRTKTSQYRGVSREKGKRKWRARIEHKGQVFELGRFESEEEAAQAYDRAALKLRGRSAKLNFGGQNLTGG